MDGSTGYRRRPAAGPAESADALPERARARIAALLRLPPDEAAAIRARIPGRRRPAPQAGPTAAYGDDLPR